MDVLIFFALVSGNIVQLYFLSCAFFYLFLSSVGILFWREKESVCYSTLHRFAILIPAHNEEKVIGNLLESILLLDYPKELFDVYVIVDHSNDKTLEISKKFGVNTIDLNDNLPSSKARALNYATSILKNKNYDAFCYFDADSLVHPLFLKTMSYYLSNGYKAIQAQQIPKNPQESIISLILSAGQFITNRFFQKPKRILGLSATLHGKGICFTKEIAEKYSWDETCLTEDLEMQMRLISDGIFILWGESALVYDEQPLTISQYVKRSVRWTRGSLDTAKKYAAKLFLNSIKNLDLRSFEAFLYTVGVYRTIFVIIAAISIYFTGDRFNILVYLFNLIPYNNFFLKLIFLMIPLFILPLIMWIDRVIRFNMFVAYYMQPLLGIIRLPIFIMGILKSRNIWDRTEHTSSVRISDIINI